MAYDLDDTIAAIASASGGAMRGLIRISGPQALESLNSCFQPAQGKPQISGLRRSEKVAGSLLLHDQRALPCELFVWPTDCSYTRQPTIEIHTLGSRPLLEAILKRVCASNVRLAEPGEFTLRAFLAGRIDLTQAEAVLGVIDAQGEQELQHALQQLAGGLSKPLINIREDLIAILAEIEAGLDFVEEDIEFISQEHLLKKLQESSQIVEATIKQLQSRADTNQLPRVVLVGRPNAGKSSLFNALIEVIGKEDDSAKAIVSHQSGTTRDYLTAKVQIGEVTCELVDTAGEEQVIAEQSIQQAAQDMTAQQSDRADLILRCVEIVDDTHKDQPAEEGEVLVLTKVDLGETLHQTPIDGAFYCSSLSGKGLNELRHEISQRLKRLLNTEAVGVASTGVRCEESLANAKEAICQAIALVENHGGEEFVAAEIRTALHEIGRVVGAVYTDDILDRIFSQFCIGK